MDKLEPILLICPAFGGFRCGGGDQGWKEGQYACGMLDAIVHVLVCSLYLNQQQALWVAELRIVVIATPRRLIQHECNRTSGSAAQACYNSAMEK